MGKMNDVRKALQKLVERQIDQTTYWWNRARRAERALQGLVRAIERDRRSSLVSEHGGFSEGVRGRVAEAEEVLDERP